MQNAAAAVVVLVLTLLATSLIAAPLLCVRADVKPSNVLINTLGQVKMCDFGISGHLVDSVAKTLDAGCKPYMAVGWGLTQT